MGYIRATNVYNICYENSFVGSDDSHIISSFMFDIHTYVCTQMKQRNKWIYIHTHVKCILEYYRCIVQALLYSCTKSLKKFFFPVSFVLFVFIFSHIYSILIRTLVTGRFLPSLNVSWDSDKYNIRSTILTRSIECKMKEEPK